MTIEQAQIRQRGIESIALGRLSLQWPLYMPCQIMPAMDTKKTIDQKVH